MCGTRIITGWKDQPVITSVSVAGTFRGSNWRLQNIFWSKIHAGTKPASMSWCHGVEEDSSLGCTLGIGAAIYLRHICYKKGCLKIDGLVVQRNHFFRLRGPYIILLFTFFEQPYKVYCIMLPHIKFMFIKSCLCLVFFNQPRDGRNEVGIQPWPTEDIWSLGCTVIEMITAEAHQWCDGNCCSSTVASWNLGGMMGVSQLWLYYGFLRLKKRAQRCMDSGSRNRDHLKNEIGNV
jgi:hypothetical protein